MAIDPYHHCPHGSGKKIKFCCPKLIAEFEKTDRLGAADQMSALEQHLERALKSHPTNLCLLGDLALARLDQGKLESASEVISTMVEHHPQNASALALQAVVVLKAGQLHEGIAQLQKAFSATSTILPTAIGLACFEVARLAIAADQPIVASAHLQATMVMNHEGEWAQHLLQQLLASDEIPLVTKSEFNWDDFTGDAEWKELFNRAMKVARSMKWQEMIDQLLPLVEQYPEEPLLWQRLAWTQAALGQEKSAAESFRRLAACERADWENRIEAAAVAEYLDIRDEDKSEMVRRTFTVTNYDELQTNLLSDRHLSFREVDRERWLSREETPPLAQFSLLDRPKIKEDAEGLTVEQLPHIVGNLQVFGKSTEQEARLEWVFYADDPIEEAAAILRRVAGSAMGEMQSEEVVDSVPREAMALTVRVLPPEEGDPKRMDDMYKECRRNAILKHWPTLRLARLGDQSAAEAAKDPNHQVAVMAAILNLETSYASTFGLETFKQLRESLQLPEPGPVTLGDCPAALFPIARVPRLEFSDVDDESLETLLRRSLTVAYRPAVKVVCLEVINRETLLENLDASFIYEQLIASNSSLQEAKEYIALAREATKDTLPSDATWDLAEFGVLLDHGEPEEAALVLQAVVQDHRNEPDVMHTVQQILVQFGMINPDGTMRAPSLDESLSEEASQEAGVWTPGQASSPSGQPESEKSGGLWLPGMD